MLCQECQTWFHWGLDQLCGCLPGAGIRAWPGWSQPTWCGPQVWFAWYHTPTHPHVKGQIHWCRHSTDLKLGCGGLGWDDAGPISPVYTHACQGGWVWPVHTCTHYLLCAHVHAGLKQCGPLPYHFQDGCTGWIWPHRGPAPAPGSWIWHSCAMQIWAQEATKCLFYFSGWKREVDS